MILVLPTPEGPTRRTERRAAIAFATAARISSRNTVGRNARESWVSSRDSSNALSYLVGGICGGLCAQKGGNPIPATRLKCKGSSGPAHGKSSHWALAPAEHDDGHSQYADSGANQVPMGGALTVD